jgi:hypothetical protein
MSDIPIAKIKCVTIDGQTGSFALDGQHESIFFHVEPLLLVTFGRHRASASTMTATGSGNVA